MEQRAQAYQETRSRQNRALRVISTTLVLVEVKSTNQGMC